MNRVTEIRYPDPSENVTFTYNTCPFGAGRLCGRIPVPQQIELTAGANNQLPHDISLLPLDQASAGELDPFVTTEITNNDVVIDGTNYGPVTLTVPPHTARIDATGELYDGLISISRIADPTHAPMPMPDTLVPSVFIAIQPFGISYDEPVPISFPNVEGFPRAPSWTSSPRTTPALGK